MSVVRLLVLTEDGASEAQRTAEAVVEGLLRLLARGRRPARIEFETVPDPVRAMVRGNVWKSKKGRQEVARRGLIRHLATRTRMRGGGWIVWHVDADQAWPPRKQPPENVRAMGELLDEVERCMSTASGVAGARGVREAVLPMVPYYSIESWLYLNHGAVEGLARQQPVAREALKWLQEHVDEVTGLDHVGRPKDACPLRGKYNRELAVTSKWPARRAVSHSPSCRATLDEWRGVPELLRALLPPDQQAHSD